MSVGDEKIHFKEQPLVAGTKQSSQAGLPALFVGR
jgi:hypothetical protein